MSSYSPFCPKFSSYCNECRGRIRLAAFAGPSPKTPI